MDATFEYTAPEMSEIDMTAEAACYCFCGLVDGAGSGP